MLCKNIRIEYKNIKVKPAVAKRKQSKTSKDSYA